MAQCCSSMLLRQMFLPGTHDSGTYAWTTPQHMPLVLDEVLAILFDIVGDLSRTQHMDVYGCVCWCWGLCWGGCWGALHAVVQQAGGPCLLSSAQRLPPLHGSCCGSVGGPCCQAVGALAAVTAGCGLCVTPPADAISVFV